MGGQVSCVRRRAFQHHRSGYSNTPFRTRSKDDLESDFLEIEATDTMPTAKKIAKPKGKLASWRYKKTDDAVVQAGQKDTNRKEKSPESMDTIDIPVVVATSPGSDIKCGCQGNGCILCDTVENLPPSGRIKRKRLVNVNTCTVFDLMALDGMDQSVATNIVIYREKKGRFKQLDKLLKVPGVTKSIYCRIAPYVTVVSLEDDDSSGLHINDGAAFDTNHCGGSGGNLAPRSSKDKGHSRQSSAVSSQKSSAANDGLDLLLQIPVDTEGGKDLEQANIDLIYRLMCSKSERPKPKTEFEKDAGVVNAASDQQPPTYDVTNLRLGCWDLEGCSFDKAHNPGVLEVICMTILENKWNFVLTTDFTSDHVLDRLVTELNFPTLYKVKLWRQSCQATPKFDCVAYQCLQTNCRYGFLFAVPFAALERVEGLRATFKIGSTSIVFSYGLEGAKHGDQISSLEEDVVHIGKRGAESPSASGNLLYFGQYVVHWNGSILSKFAGRAGIVEEGLSHLAIPNGWTLGGRVTRSNPIWVHFPLSGESRPPVMP